MTTNDFFAARTEGSEVKTEIVRKYFWAWAKIISKQVKRRGGEKIGYADLFAGKGRYDDGTKSTPVLILEGAIRDQDIREMLVAVFNDAESSNAESLKREIARIEGIETLKHQPNVINTQTGDSLAEKFERAPTIPALFFLDPWGYKGLSLRLIKAVLKPWGCDCIFFFNYNRINAALSNPKFTSNMNAFFGDERAGRLRGGLGGKSPEEREQLIIAELKRALKELGAKYNVEYFFKDTSGHKTSHFLILASKHPLAEKIMKQIMASESSSADHGFASFGFNPLDKKKSAADELAPTLFDMTDPIADLAQALIDEYAGRTMAVRNIFQQHHIGKPYTLRNYQDALKRLEAEGRIRTDPPADRRRRSGKITLAESVMVTFLTKEAPNGIEVEHRMD